MKHTIEIDGEQCDIEIRAMDESFIVYRKMYVPPLTRDNIGNVNPGDWAEHLEQFKRKGWQEVIEAFFRKQIRALGSCAILAWDGDGVIGKMYFTTLEMWDAFRAADACMCVEHESMPKMIQGFNDEEIECLLASPSKTLYVLCFNIGHFDARYQGKGIASAMLTFLKQWAAQRNWHRLEMLSCDDVVPYVVLGGHVLRRSRLERDGFSIARDEGISSEEAAGRREAIRRILSGELWPESSWYMKSCPDDIMRVRQLALNNASWETDCEKDYVMAFDLSNQQEQN